MRSPGKCKALSKARALLRRWRTHSVLWVLRGIKRKALTSFRQNEKRILEPKHSFERRPTADERPRNEACKVDRTPSV